MPKMSACRSEIYVEMMAVPLRKLTQLTERLNLDTYIQRYKVVAVLNTLFGLIWVVHVMAAWQQEPALEARMPNSSPCWHSLWRI